MDTVSEHKSISGSVTIDRFLHIRKGSEGFYEFLGAREMYGISRIIHPDDIGRLESGIEALDQNSSNVVALRMAGSEQQYIWMILFLSLSDVEEDGKKMINIEIEDVTNFKKEMDELKNNNIVYSEYFSLMECMMISYDLAADRLKLFAMGSQQMTVFDGTMEKWRKREAEIQAIAPKSRNEYEKLLEAITKGYSTFKIELNTKTSSKSDKRYWCMINGKTIADVHGNAHAIATLSMVNVVTRKQNTGELNAMTRDAGTDLLNKRAITSYVKELLEKKPPYNVTIAIIDLDNFKNVNDTFGHQFGDEVLFKTAEVIKNAVANRGVAGRIGGDELFIVLEKMEGESDIRGVLRTIRTNVEWLYKGKLEITVTCSMGCASYPADADNYEDLFKIADRMLYLAKEKGKNRYILYEEAIHKKYLSGTGDIIVRNKGILVFNKLALVNEIMDECYTIPKEQMNWNEVCDRICGAFELDDIGVYYAPDMRRQSLWSIFGDATMSGDYLTDETYLKGFDELGLYVVDSVLNLDGMNDKAYKALTEQKIFASVQYMVKRDDEIADFITFNKSKTSKKWSSQDTSYLCILGHIIAKGLFE